MQVCICPFCVEPSRPMYLYTDAALQWLAQTVDEHHKLRRVYAFMELFYRAGVCDPLMPYRVWIAIMGTDVDPPFACCKGGGGTGTELANMGIGAFQTPRSPSGQVCCGDWPWWDIVERPMPWSVN